MNSQNKWSPTRIVLLAALVAVAASLQPLRAEVRDGGIDPANLGKGDWIYFMSDATNHLGGHAAGVTNEASLMSFFHSQGIEWIVVKAATGPSLFPSASTPQFTQALVNHAHAAGLKIFGYNRSDGTDVPGEILIADYVFQQGADGFVFDAEAEWESSRLGSAGPALAIQLCSAVRSNWPTKFLAHAPLPVISSHRSFPYKEFGYYCDAVMPQDYWKSIGVSATAMLQWMDTEWRNWQNSLTGIWTNSIKPIAPLAQGWSPSSSEILTGAEIAEFYAAIRNDAEPVTPGGYRGISFWRADLHTADMWDAIRTNALVDTTTIPPAILMQPASLAVIPGDNATLTVVATGTAPIHYQWQRNGSNLSGATASTYTKLNVKPADAGTYSVVLTNRFGMVTSDDAVLTVNIPPAITTQPDSQWVTAGDTVTFTVTATGTALLSYQWRRNGQEISGANASSYTLSGVQQSDAGDFAVVVTNVAGSITSAVATLTVTLSPVAPAVTAQPASQTVILGQTATFTVTATGTTPLSYQWRYNGAPIAGATRSRFSLSPVALEQAGVYSVLVTNAVGEVLSDDAQLVVNPQQVVGADVLWSLGGGSRWYLGSSGMYERGMGYNPVTDTVLVVSRASSYAIMALDGSTGAELHSLYLDSSIISGGTYLLSMIGVAADGAVYAANLTTAGSATPFRVYRWADDSPSTVPTVAFAGDPSPGDSQRWGDNFAVRGAGADTQILVGSRNGTSVSILTTTDGLHFTAHPVSVPNVEPGAFGLSVAFGAENTFWSKAKSLPLRQVAFDLGSDTGTVLRSFTNDFPSSISPIAVEPARSLLAGVAFDVPDNLKLYDLSSATAPPSLISSHAFATDYANSYYVGAVAFGNDRVYALDSNNGLLALQLLGMENDSPPVIVGQPQSVTVFEGSSVALQVRALGAQPFSYQWFFDGIELPAATNATLTLEAVTTYQSGLYCARVSNAYGSTLSSNAVLNVISVGTSVVDDFDPDIDLSQWYAFYGTALATNYAGAVSGPNSLWFGDSTMRYAITRPVNTLAGGSIRFDLRIAGGSAWPWAKANLPDEAVELWCLTEETGSWVTLGRYDTYDYTNWTSVALPVPEAARSAVALFVWLQPYGSRACCGQWALDNVRIETVTGPTPPVILTQPQDQDAARGDTVIFHVGAYGSEPLSCQWWFSNQVTGAQAPVGENSSTLILRDVTPNETGQYWVVLTNAYGSVMSASARLTVGPGTTLAEALDGPGLTWLTTGDAFWRGETNVTHDTVDAAASGTIKDNQQTTLQTTVIGPGTVSFWYKVSSESGYDYFKFYIGTALQASIAGEVNWAQRSFSVPAGVQTLSWTYAKDSSVSQGQDKAWLDQVSYTPTGPPVITAQPRSLYLNQGQPASFSVAATGKAPLAYQWRFNGVAIPGATETSLTLANPQAEDAGTYCVFITNTVGSAISSNATLRVNLPPVADASATRTLLISANGVDATAVLDGSRCSDCNGDPLQYLWLRAGSPASLATSAIAIVTLPVGTNCLMLIVSDGMAASTNAVTVVVLTTGGAVQRLIALVNESAVRHNRPLTASLEAALASINRGNANAAANQLHAFQNKVQAQVARTDPALGALFCQAAQQIVEALAGSPDAKPRGLAHGRGSKGRLSFTGAAGQLYVIEASTNLVNWEPVGLAIEPGNGSFTFDDQQAGSLPRRFYRVVTP